MAETFTPSALLQYLPAIYREDPFMGQFLLAFEKLLLGRADTPDPDLNPAGLEQIIDGLATLYDPLKTPDEFVPWLSKWTALSLRADMTLEQQRMFIAQIIQLYQYRGTQANLVKLLELFLAATPAIEIPADDKPYFFHVKITLPRREVEFVKRQQEIAQALVELEKPAHTDYTLTVNTPTLRIGEFSTVGVDTLLGTIDTASAAGQQKEAENG
jgi:phage tail-like protein